MKLRPVDTLSGAPGPAARPSEAEGRLRAALDPSTLEPDVRRLASPVLEGRRRGSRGSALAREHLVARLRAGGLEPLFGGSFEQPIDARPTGRTPHATNVGALWRSAAPRPGWVALVAHYDHLGIVRGKLRPGADDNASSVAIVLAIAGAVARARPAYPNHLAFVFPDAEEPPDTLTARMGSTRFWRSSPFPIDRLRCALVLDLMGGIADPSMREAGLGGLLFALGTEASPGLVRLVRSVAEEPSVEPVLLGLPMIETLPYVPGRRFSVSDYHGLRPFRRPFVFLSTGRSHRYHTAEDTPDSLDYPGLARRARWCAGLAARAADGTDDLGWEDGVVDPLADARATARLLRGIGAGERFPAILRRALLADRRRVEAILERLEGGERPEGGDYRALQLACLRLQAAMWHPPGWWFALW
ncbi:MAG TPA: M28 family peptidase [Planctomycetota bacterium]|jgi:hypothetical protein|nr:M28 family peptidase [Planctomycetota bacterium]